MSEPQTSTLDAPVVTTGTFVWHELVTPEPAAAKAFYTSLFGWNTRVDDMGDAGFYTMFECNEQGIGGIGTAPDDEAAPPHWRSYVTVPDVDAVLEIEGTRVLLPPMDMPDVGRFAFIADPTGAIIAPFKGSSDEPMPDVSAPGMICWNELVTSDPDRAAAYYEQLCGWTNKTEHVGDGKTYVMFHREDGTPAAGMIKTPPNVPTHWFPYVAAEDPDAAVAKAQQLSGQVIVAPTDIPGGGRFAVLHDPTGAVFGVLSM